MTENGKPEFLDVFCLNFYGLLVFLCVGQPMYENEYEEHDYVRLYELDTSHIGRVTKRSNPEQNGKLIKLRKNNKIGWFANKQVKDCLLVPPYAAANNCSNPPLIADPVIVDSHTFLPVDIHYNDRICREVERLGLKDIDSMIVGTHYAVYIGGIGDELDTLTFMDCERNNNYEESFNVEIEC